MSDYLKYNEEGMFESLRNGHDEGFSFIFKHWYKHIYYYAFSIVKNKEEAEDITDECFIKVWERRTMFTSLQRCKSFLYTCVRNACIDNLKKHKVIVSSEKEIGYLNANENDNNLLQEDILIDGVLNLQNALKELPECRRKIFQMVYFDGKSAKEVARALNISVHTVKSQKQKGFSLLRKILLPYILK